MKNTFKVLLLTIAVFVAAWYGFNAIFSSDEKPSQGSGQVGQSGPLPVDIFVVEGRTIQNRVKTTGTLMPGEKTNLQTEVSGKITGIYFDEGERVEAGKLLLKLNADELEAQLNTLNIELEYAQKQLKRQKNLIDSGGISQEQYDAALNRKQVLEGQIKQVEASVEKRKLYAPYDGVVGLRYVSVGDNIAPTTEVASIVNTDRLKLEFAVPEKYYSTVREGDSVQFTITGRDSTYSAVVYAIEPEIDPDTRSVILRASFDNKENSIFPGVFAFVDYALSDIPSAFMVPTQSLVPELKGQKVYVKKNGKITEKSVETGIRTDKMIQLTDGVATGDSVLTTGILQANPGMPVGVRNVVNSNYAQ